MLFTEKFIIILINGVLNITIMKLSSVRYMIVWLPSEYMAWVYFCLFYKNYIVYKIFNITMRYPQWNYITVHSSVFTSAVVSEVRLLKQKNNEKMSNWLKGLFNKNLV